MTPGVALARVWLLKEEPGGAPFLKLRASIGSSIARPGVLWNHTDGEHARLPLSFGKVGRTARETRPTLLLRGGDEWLVHEDWAQEEQIESFAAQPLTSKGQTLGVLAFFSRERLDKDDLNWLRVYADHAALAVETARVNEELARLKDAAENERDYLRAAIRERQHPAAMVAESAAMRRVLRQAEAISQSDSPVLVFGESGVGKELIATALHDLSRRKVGPLVKVNCASVPKELFESEFFGHVRGAFSGAVRDRQGRFALADGGTLLLDEVGEIPLPLQAKLLRVLQEQTYEMIGDETTRRVDVRIIAATNRDLEQEVERGAFRQDLYYRLGVLPLSVPPLRQRREDILPMAERFLHATARRLNVRAPGLADADQRALLAYDYPGNVRELQNIIERALVLGAAHPGRSSLGIAAQLNQARSPADAEAAAAAVSEPDRILTEAEMRRLEKSNLHKALQQCSWKVAGDSGAAQLLQISPSTLSYRMKQLGLKKPE